MNRANTIIQSATEVVETDLNYICNSLENEFSQLAGKNILITGGAGFLGYYLIQSLLKWNEKVAQKEKINIIIYDNYIRGIPEWLQQVKHDDYLGLVKHDVRNPLPDSVIDFHYIIHAASIASPIYYRKHPLETMDANVNGLRYLLEYTRNRKKTATPVEGFLFFSTSEVYGDPHPDYIPTPETYRGNVSCTGPRACYDESKRYGETLCVTFAQEFDLPISIARPFNNYGPGLKITDRRVIPDFMRDVLSGKNIVMHSDGSPSRTFCYIADAITGYFKILVNGKPGDSYNIGVSEPEITMTELAERIITIARDHINYHGEVQHIPSNDEDYLVDNPNRRCPVISKAENELGYSPSIGLEEGLIRNLLWYNENQEAEEA
ncbi:NAD-dependent epimerase/dehydratase family protein [Fodinibius saliphilus]|uniref:NAD-dependent epimerase/dehydratase family protein n=1 Tax=Fodinibius saliphilus TaxID=1920650 RepID=UPI0014869D1B|nr:NAD-dependent epimerase/dehydratase family protein [Fodinibius saliphilus]